MGSTPTPTGSRDLGKLFESLDEAGLGAEAALKEATGDALRQLSSDLRDAEDIDAEAAIEPPTGLGLDQPPGVVLTDATAGDLNEPRA